MKSWRIRSIKTLIGPYDVGPVFGALTIGLINQIRLRQTSYEYHFGVARVRFFLLASALDIFVSLLFYVALVLLARLWPKRSHFLSHYILGVLFIALLSNLTDLLGSKVLMQVMHIKNYLLIDNFLSLLGLKFIFATILIAVTHSRSKVLEVRLTVADKLNTMLSARYAALVETDEEIRDQAARLLHDRIQGELMLAAARLSKAVQSISEDGQAEIVAVIKVLEKIRSTDVRQVSQLLTPNLAGEGLIGACETLCDGFGSQVDVDLQINPGVETLEESVKLGLFRIIEQGLMNSIKHGPASRVTIRIFVDDSGLLQTVISDNGPGSTGDNLGKGTQIIDAWVAILQGEKVIESKPGSGYALKVSIPIQPTI